MAIEGIQNKITVGKSKAVSILLSFSNMVGIVIVQVGSIGHFIHDKGHIESDGIFQMVNP